MALDAAIADEPLSRRRMLRPVALALAAVAAALCAAAWITDSDQTAALALAALPGNPDRISFEDRFSPASTPQSSVGYAALQPLDRSALAVVEAKIRAAKDRLAQRLMSPHLSNDLVDEARVDEPRVDEARPSAAAGIPLPRSRPAAADVAARPGSVLAQAEDAARQDDRTLLQRLSDLLPARIKLASLTPGDGLFRQGPDLATLGYDNLTAVYDISAHAVYLPSGLSLEAHSGMGSLRDDPEHVSVSNTGATPPAIYDLKPREKLFHGVQALRMIPAEGSDISGRTGLLTHSFMLGPNGDSNGCVSIRDYPRFLKAFNDGEFNRLVVVPSLDAATVASRRSTSQS